jgi:hypothetical protein
MEKPAITGKEMMAAVEAEAIPSGAPEGRSVGMVMLYDAVPAVSCSRRALRRNTPTLRQPRIRSNPETSGL